MVFQHPLWALDRSQSCLLGLIDMYGVGPWVMNSAVNSDILSADVHCHPERRFASCFLMSEGWTLSSLQSVGLPLIAEQEIASLNPSAYKIFPLHSATCIHEAVLAALSFYSFVSIGLVFIVQMGPSLTYASIECMHRIELFFFFTETTLLFKWIEICSFCAVKKIQHSVIFVIFVSINDMLLNNWDLHL